MDIIELIDKKEAKGTFTYEEIDFIVKAYLKDQIKDYQMSSLLMAICINGMTDEEVFNLTKVMLDSGEHLDLSSISGIKVDKHSTGGVGDKTTLIVAPLAASCGVIIPKMSGRGLGHTGGTIDKLEAIPCFKTTLSTAEFTRQLQGIGVAITTSSMNIVPADKKIYALRDVTGTVSSIPLIASSVMSKKLAIGADKIVLDVKVGKGAFMNNLEDAKELAKTMVNIGKRFNKETIAIITNMNCPLGNNIGNSLEVLESIEVLNGKGNQDLRELCIVLASYMVSIGKNIPYEEAKKMVVDNLNNGKALEKFNEMIKAQGGNIGALRVSTNIIDIKSPKDGYINNINALELGEFSMSIGAGRRSIGDIIDYTVGIVLIKTVGDYVKKDDVIAKIYMGHRNVDTSSIYTAFDISENKKEKEPLIYAIVK